MKKSVIRFFVLLFMFTLALGLLSSLKTGKMSNITGYSISLEEDGENHSSYGLLLGVIAIGLLIAYIVKFIFSSYRKSSREISFKKRIDLELN